MHCELMFLILKPMFSNHKSYGLCVLLTPLVNNVTAMSIQWHLPVTQVVMIIQYAGKRAVIQNLKANVSLKTENRNYSFHDLFSKISNSSQNSSLYQVLLPRASIPLFAVLTSLFYLPLVFFPATPTFLTSLVSVHMLFFFHRWPSREWLSYYILFCLPGSQESWSLSTLYSRP